MAYGQSTYPEHGEAQLKLLFLCGNVVLWHKEVSLFCECLLSSYCKKKTLTVNSKGGKKLSFSSAPRSPRWCLELQPSKGWWSLQSMRPSQQSSSSTFQMGGTHLSCNWVRTGFLAKAGLKFLWALTASELRLQWLFAGCLAFFVFDVPWQFSRSQAQGVLDLMCPFGLLLVSSWEKALDLKWELFDLVISSEHHLLLVAMARLSPFLTGIEIWLLGNEHAIGKSKMEEGGLHMEIFLGYLGIKSNCKPSCPSIYLSSVTTASLLLPFWQKNYTDNSPGPGRQNTCPNPADMHGTSFSQFYYVSEKLYFCCCYLNFIRIRVFFVQFPKIHDIENNTPKKLARSDAVSIIGIEIIQNFLYSL